MAGSALNAIIIASSFILIFSQHFESERNKERNILRELLPKKKNIEKLMYKKIPEKTKRKLRSDYDKLYGELHRPKMGFNFILLLLLGFIIFALALHITILFSDPDFANLNLAALSVIVLVSFFIGFILIIGIRLYLTMRKQSILHKNFDNFMSTLNVLELITTASKESSAEPQTSQ